MYTQPSTRSYMNSYLHSVLLLIEPGTRLRHIECIVDVRLLRKRMVCGDAQRDYCNQVAKLGCFRAVNVRHFNSPTRHVRDRLCISFGITRRELTTHSARCFPARVHPIVSYHRG